MKSILNSVIQLWATVLFPLSLDLFLQKHNVAPCPIFENVDEAILPSIRTSLSASLVFAGDDDYEAKECFSDSLDLMALGKVLLPKHAFLSCCNAETTLFGILHCFWF